MYLINFPHAYDPYRLIGLILNNQPALLEKSQGEVGVSAGIKQYQVSRLLNMEMLAKKARNPRGLNRVNLLALTIRGLRLSYREAALLLWLAEAERYRPWTEEEFKKAGVKTPGARSLQQVSAYDADQMRTFEGVLKLLRKTFQLNFLDDGWNKLETQVLHGNSATSRMALYEVLEEMEMRPGQRMLVSKYPSILVSADIANSSDTVRSVRGPQRSELIKQLVNRQSTFQMRLNTYGERAIHSIPSLKRFVTKGITHPISLKERKNRVAGLIGHLDKYYPKFQVGLSDTEPEVEIAIKSTESAVIRGTARELSNHPDTIVCGPSYLYWDDLLAVITFYLDFEKEWLKLQRSGRTDKKKVIGMLRDLIT